VSTANVVVAFHHVNLPSGTVVVRPLDPLEPLDETPARPVWLSSDAGSYRIFGEPKSAQPV
jgi:hypothetical protein